MVSQRGQAVLISLQTVAECISVPVRGLSSAGRAPDLHSGGHRFDPDRLHQPSLLQGEAREMGR